MGTWGTSIFANDTAADVSDMYEDMLISGFDPEEAERRIIQEFNMDNDDDFSAWSGLAAAEWRCGRYLSERVKNKTIALIDAGADLELWNTAQQRNRRKLALEKLRQQLLSPLPKPKRLKKISPVSSPWDIGDVLMVRMPVDNMLMDANMDKCGLSDKYALIQVAAIERIKCSRFAADDETIDAPFFLIYHWWGDDMESARQAISKQVFAYKRHTRQIGNEEINKIYATFQIILLEREMKEYDCFHLIAHVDTLDPPNMDWQKTCDYHNGGAIIPHYIQMRLLESMPVKNEGKVDIKYIV